MNRTLFALAQQKALTNNSFSQKKKQQQPKGRKNDENEKGKENAQWKLLGRETESYCLPFDGLNFISSSVLGWLAGMVCSVRCVECEYIHRFSHICLVCFINVDQEPRAESPWAICIQKDFGQPPRFKKSYCAAKLIKIWTIKPKTELKTARPKYEYKCTFTWAWASKRKNAHSMLISIFIIHCIPFRNEPHFTYKMYKVSLIFFKCAYHTHSLIHRIQVSVLSNAPHWDQRSWIKHT